MEIAVRSGGNRGLRIVRLAGLLLLGMMVLGNTGARAEDRGCIFFCKKNGTNQASTQQASGHVTTPQGGKAVTETQIVAGQDVTPFLSASSPADMQAALDRYLAIQAAGGWPQVGASARMKKGSESSGIAALNKRLFIEGYLRREATEGEFASRFTSATEDAVVRFQRNHGLAATGAVDTVTAKELNIPVERRIATIRANLPRVQEYAKDLGERYVVVNVPAMQLETVSGGKVYSIHNAIVGRPSRPTPVVETNLATVRFNPYWNAPASIVERDIIPRMLSSGPSRVLSDMNMKVFKGVNGPEVDPDSVNWRKAVPDDYHFRQEPGGGNAMKTAKIEFNSPFGIYLHDTPDPQLFKGGMRFLSSGCVRVDQVPILINWILQGQDGINEARIAELADTKERLDVQIANAPQLRVAYLTAWPNGNGPVSFRTDVYKMDGSGFIVGQPLDVADTSGPRFVLKPIPRTASAVEADEAGGFSFLNLFSRGSDRGAGPVAAVAQNTKGNDAKTTKATQTAKTAKTSSKSKPGSFLMSSSAQSKAKKVAAKTAKTGAKKTGTKTTTATKAKSTAKAADSKSASSGKAKSKTSATQSKAASTKATGSSATAKTTSKPADQAKSGDQCKPDKDGKLPQGCKPAATAKPKPKPTAEAKAATETTAAN